MKHSEVFKELPMALSKFQAEVTNPKLTAENPHFKSKYAPLSEVFNVVRPILTKHGLSVFQDLGTEDDKVVVTTTIFHESGEFLESDPLKIPAGRGGKPVDAQGIGAAASYAKRYQLQSCLGITADSEDDGELLVGQTPTVQTMNNPSKAQIAAKYQLIMGSRKHFDDFYRVYSGQFDDTGILTIVDNRQTLANMFEKGKGSREGFEEYCAKMVSEGKDEQFIFEALKKAIEKKQAETA